MNHWSSEVLPIRRRDENQIIKLKDDPRPTILASLSPPSQGIGSPSQGIGSPGFLSWRDGSVVLSGSPEQRGSSQHLSIFLLLLFSASELKPDLFFQSCPSTSTYPSPSFWLPDSSWNAALLFQVYPPLQPFVLQLFLHPTICWSLTSPELFFGLFCLQMGFTSSPSSIRACFIKHPSVYMKIVNSDRFTNVESVFAVVVAESRSNISWSHSERFFFKFTQSSYNLSFSM